MNNEYLDATTLYSFATTSMQFLPNLFCEQAVGVKIYERHDALLHAKIAVIDGVLSTVESSNLDWRSFVKNYEVNAVVLRSAIGNQTEVLFREDLSRSDRVDMKAWIKRPLYG